MFSFPTGFGGLGSRAWWLEILGEVGAEAAGPNPFAQQAQVMKINLCISIFILQIQILLAAKLPIGWVDVALHKVQGARAQIPHYAQHNARLPKEHSQAPTSGLFLALLNQQFSSGTALDIAGRTRSAYGRQWLIIGFRFLFNRLFCLNLFWFFKKIWL